jgi:Protein of unknwon function (DUF3008)
MAASAPWNLRTGTRLYFEAKVDCQADTEDVMPARSKKQQMAAGAALAAKRGERSKSSLKGASREMVESMSERQLREFASTKRRSLPRKKRG